MKWWKISFYTIITFFVFGWSILFNLFALGITLMEFCILFIVLMLILITIICINQQEKKNEKD